MKYYLFSFFFVSLFACQQNPKPQPPEKETANIVKDSVEKPIPEALPVVKTPDYDTSLWTDIAFLDSSILIDMKYATSDNFVGEQMYDCGRCFLRPLVAKALVKVQQRLQAKGLGLKMFDCYRPRPIQSKLWEKVPDARYVTPPARGSMHNKGAAVDLTIVDAEGKELDMGTGYDFFGKEAYHDYTAHSDTIAQNRRLLLETLRAEGFKHIRTEWWHYAYIKKQGYPLSDYLWNCD